MERLKPHKKLGLWKEIIEFVVFIYKVTARFPREEEFGLKSQLRRAAVSLPSNVSEGLTRRTMRDKTHFLNMTQSSLSEIDAQIEVSRRLEFIDTEIETKANERMSKIERLLSGLIRKIEND